MSRQSRLEQISRRRSLHHTILILAGIIVLISIFIVYGVPMLINLSILAEKLKGNNDKDTVDNTSSYIAPPMLDTLKDATNSAQINISGSALPDQEIKLYVNGKYIDKTRVRTDKSFIFQDVNLEPGANSIKAKALISDKESDYSQDMQIAFINNAPNLDITSPRDNQSISNSDGLVKVEGKTDPSVRVTVNDFWAIVESQGNFSYSLHLQKGDNAIKVVATDDAGNSTEKQIKVKLE